MSAFNSLHELLPCPFCGEVKVIVLENESDTHGEWAVTCHACGASTDVWTYEIGAITAWNKRVK